MSHLACVIVISQQEQDIFVTSMCTCLSCRCMHTLPYLDCQFTQFALPTFCLTSLLHLFSVLAYGYSYLVFYACLIFTEAFFAYLVYYNWYGYLVAQSAMITYNTAYLISQPAIITSSCMHMPCLVYMSIKSTMPKYHSKFPIAFCAHLVSFSNIRFILSNGTYTTEFVVSNHARFKIIRQHYGFIWRENPFSNDSVYKVDYEKMFSKK